MKKYLLFLLLGLIGLTAHAQNQIYGLVVITNNPAINETIDVNSDVRTWKSTVTDPSTEITRGASIGASFTNLVLHLRKYPFANISALELSGSTNTVRLFGRSGDALAVTITTNWASRTYVTNSVKSVVNNHRVVNDLAEMQALDPSLYASVTIRYYETLGDGGGGRFYASSDSLTSDGGTIIASESKAGWYWVREFVGPVYTEWWGANGTDHADDSSAFNEAASNFKHIAFLPGRHYKIDANLTGSGYWLEGPGGAFGGTTKIQSASTNVYAITIGNNSTAVSGIEISGLNFHGGTTNNYGVRIRGNVDGVKIRDCYFNRFKGTALHVLGESNPIKNVLVQDTGFLQGTEGDLDYIRVIQSSANNVSGITFNGCIGTSTDSNDLVDVDSVAVEMLGCRWDVGSNNSRVRLSKSQTTNPSITGKSQVTTSGTFSNPVDRIDFAVMGGVVNNTNSWAKTINDSTWTYAVNKVIADGGGTIYFPPGDWYFNNQMYAEGANGLEVLGSGKTTTVLRGFATDQNGLVIRDSDRIKVSKLKIYGVASSSPPTTEKKGLRIDGGCDDVLIEDVWADACDDAGIAIEYYNGASANVVNTNVRIINSIGSNSPYGAGIECFHAEGLVVANCEASGNAQHGIRLNSNIRASVYSNLSHNNGNHGISLQAQPDAWGDWHKAYDTKIFSNTLEDNPYGVVIFNHVEKLAVFDNLIKRTAIGVNLFGVYFNTGTGPFAAKDVQVHNNIIEKYSYGVYLNCGTNILDTVRISNNNILDMGSSSAGDTVGVRFNGNAAHNRIFVESNTIKTDFVKSAGFALYGIIMGSAGTNLFALNNKIYMNSPTAYVSNGAGATTQFNSVETNVQAGY